MSGKKANRNNTPNRRPNDPTPTRMTAVLDQLAADANTQRREDPNMAALEPNLKALYAEYTRLCGHLDEVTAGAALLVVGQLCAAHVNRQPNEGKVEALASLPNLMRLVGAQLYAGTTTEVEITCPFTYMTGAPCTKTVAGATRGHAELLMKGHVWQHHPDEEWPPAADEDGTEEGADEGVADAVNLAPTDPAAQAAAITDFEVEVPDDGDGPEECTHPKDARMHLPGGERCSACGHWIGC